MMRKWPQFLCVFILLACVCWGQEGKFDWRKDSKELCPGIRLASVAVEQPRLIKMQVARIQLRNPKLGICVTKADPDKGQPMPDYPKGKIVTRRQRTKDFILQCRKSVKEGGRGVNMVLASNTCPWGPWCPPWNHQYAWGLGLVVSDGELVCDGNGRPAFIVYKDGTCDICLAPKGMDISNIQFAVTGFGMVLEEGKTTFDITKAKSLEEDAKILAPRTGFGLSSDRKYLIIVAIDGRQPDFSLGTSTAEVGEWLRYFGADKGVNMDGGGSTTLAIWDQEKKQPVMLNHQPGGGERTVSCNIGFYLKKAKNKKHN